MPKPASEKPVNKKIIAVDIDEVLFPMVTDLISYLDREHSTGLSEEDFVKYHFEDVWAGGPVEASEIFERYKDQLKVEVAPVKGAAKALKTLAKDYEVIVMTARDEGVSQTTNSWINYHFPQLFKNVHFVGNKYDSKVWRSKAEVCGELGVSWLVDDNLKTIIEAAEAGIGAILFGDYSWNRTEELPSDVVRARGWGEVLKYFDAAAK